MADIPYRPRVKLGSLRQTARKMMVTKTGSSRVTEERTKKFLRQDKGLRRATFGPATSTMESWRGRRFVKDVKEKIGGSEQYRYSVYAKKTGAAKIFRDTVREEIRQEEAEHPKGLTKEQVKQQRLAELGKKHLHQYERAKQIEQETGKPFTPLPTDPNAPMTSVSDQIRTSSVASGSPVSPPPTKPMTLASGMGKGFTRPPSDKPSGRVTPGTTASGTRGTPAMSQLPSVFGLRGRVLRNEPQRQTILVHVLNTPPELAVFIGRDKIVKILSGARCWRERHAIECGEILNSEHVDVRGKIINGEFVAEDVYVNSGDLPDFVMRLSSAEPSPELPSETPSDLAI